jgi:hypothetical protein
MRPGIGAFRKNLESKRDLGPSRKSWPNSNKKEAPSLRMAPLLVYPEAFASD